MADKKKVLMVIAASQFRDEELLEPRKIFLDEGLSVTVACPLPGQATGMLGASIEPDVLLKDARSADYDAIVVVGGMGSPEYLWDNPDLHKILQEMHGANKVIAAICLSGAALAKAGVLEGKQATVWPMPESLSALGAGKAKYLKQPLVQDGRTITADGPEAAGDFGRAIVKELSAVASKT